MIGICSAGISERTICLRIRRFVTLSEGAEKERKLNEWKEKPMEENTREYPENREEMYPLVIEQLRSLTQDEPLVLPNLANAAALLYGALPQVNWAGFYLLREDVLILGPFQGKTACIRIPVGKGVCGTAVAADSIQCVPDVHRFPGHIACDSNSRSEIVIPIHHSGRVIGVLDIDSPAENNFSETDIRFLKIFTEILENCCDWERFSVC